MLRVANKSFRAAVHYSGIHEHTLVPGIVTAQLTLFLYTRRYTPIRALVIDLCCLLGYCVGSQLMDIGELELSRLEVLVLTVTPCVAIEMRG